VPLTEALCLCERRNQHKQAAQATPSLSRLPKRRIKSLQRLWIAARYREMVVRVQRAMQALPLFLVACH